MQPIAYAFDVTNIDPFVQGGAPVPAGQYPAAIRAMSVKPNNVATTGHNLACEYVITDGEFKGRKVFDNLNLWHTGSTAACEIAMKQLSSIGHAVGVLSGGDLTLLCNKPMLIEVSYEEGTPAGMNPNTGEATPERKPRNTILRRDPLTSESSAQAAPHIPASQPVSQPNAAAAQAAPAFQAPAQAQPAAQAAPAFTPAPTTAPATAAVGAPATAPGGAVPPWQQK